MIRRDLLRTAAGIGATTGFEGCSCIIGGCGKPPEELFVAIPRNGKFGLQGEPITDSSGEDVDQRVLAKYFGPDGETYHYGITKVVDREVAEANMTDARSPGDSTLGWVRVEEYVYFARGPAKEGVRALLAESKPLDEGCVENEAQFA